MEKKILLKLKFVTNYILKGEALGPANISQCVFFKRQSCKMLWEILSKSFYAQMYAGYIMPSLIKYVYIYVNVHI